MPALGILAFSDFDKFEHFKKRAPKFFRRIDEGGALVVFGSEQFLVDPETSIKVIDLSIESHNFILNDYDEFLYRGSYIVKHLNKSRANFSGWNKVQCRNPKIFSNHQTVRVYSKGTPQALPFGDLEVTALEEALIMKMSYSLQRMSGMTLALESLISLMSYESETLVADCDCYDKVLEVSNLLKRYCEQV